MLGVDVRKHKIKGSSVSLLRLWLDESILPQNVVKWITSIQAIVKTLNEWM